MRIPTGLRAGVLALALVLGVAQPALARPVRPGSPGGARPVPTVLGYPAVASPATAVPSALPRKAGSVSVDTTRRARPTRAPAPGTQAGPTPKAESAPSGPASAATPSAGPGAAANAVPSAAANADPNAVPSAGPGAAAVTGPVRVGLRALVVAVDGADFGVPTWRSTLDRVGAAYDVLYTTATPLTAETLVRPDGTGRYNAILLTNSMLLHQDAGGSLVSGLSADQWNLLWAYERDYAVRQATLYSGYGTWPEDYCLRARTEGGVGATPLAAALTSNGAALFDYLKPSAQIPIVESYVYRTQLATGCDGQAVLTAGTDVLGVRTTSADGRQRMALTFTSNQYLMQANLLTYGLFRWASRGLFLGELRHYLNVDVDDWFNTADEQLPNGTINTDPGYRMSGHDAYNVSLQQAALRTRYPLASGLTFGMAYNGGDANLAANSTCYPNGGINRLTSTTRCLRNTFRWINHTLSHPELNFTDYATNVTEISQNLAVAQQLGLPVDASVLKTGEYSGLGVYNPDPNDDVDPPTDFGLGASNPELLRAARDLGVRYLHGNMSFPSHQPSCFNCGIVHPLEPSLTIVADWPTNIAYFATTAAEETYFYNSFYGPNGRFPFWPVNLTYSQLLEYETDQALSRMATGTVYTNTFHIGNLRDYGGGRTLLSDWADRLLAKYSALYAVPVLSPGWPALAAYASARNAHFAELSAGVDAVYEAAANTLTVTSPASGSLTVSGAQTTGSTGYGSDVSAPITLAANVPVTISPRVLP